MDSTDPRNLSLPDRLLKRKQELWRGERRRSLLAFACQAPPASERPAEHHKLICAKLEQLIRGELDRLLMIAPPDSANTIP